MYFAVISVYGLKQDRCVGSTVFISCGYLVAQAPFVEEIVFPHIVLDPFLRL